MAGVALTTIARLLVQAIGNLTAATYLLRGARLATAPVSHPAGMNPARGTAHPD